MRMRSSGSAAEEEGDDSSASADLNDVLEGCSTSDAAISILDSSSPQTTSRQSISQRSSHELDRRKSIDKRTSTARSRVAGTNWKLAEPRNAQMDNNRPAEPTVISVPLKEAIEKMPDSRQNPRRTKFRSPWSSSLLTLVTTAVASLCLFAIIHSFVGQQLDTKGCRMSYMRPSFAKLSDFDTEHTRFASKYSVYLYREGMVDEDTKVWNFDRSRESY